jgi:hypothetical protein
VALLTGKNAGQRTQMQVLQIFGGPKLLQE